MASNDAGVSLPGSVFNAIEDNNGLITARRQIAPDTEQRTKCVDNDSTGPREEDMDNTEKDLDSTLRSGQNAAGNANLRAASSLQDLRTTTPVNYSCYVAFCSHLVSVALLLRKTPCGYLSPLGDNKHCGNRKHPFLPQIKLISDCTWNR